MSARRAMAAASIVWFSLMGHVLAQERKAAQPDINRKAKVAAEIEIKKPAATAGMVHRASEIAGMPIRNAQGKELGTVKDIVIDVKAGEVRYAALSYGGFLGLGDKLFAVPWDALKHHHNVADEKHYLVLNVDEETLKRAPGFDPDKWPNFADQQFSGGIDKYYSKFRTERRVKTDARDGKVRVEVEVKPNPAAPRTADSPSLTSDNLHRASKITGMTVKNLAGKELGSVNDLVIEMESGKVRYAALSYGGFLGLGDKLFAVPWSAFDFRFNPADKQYFLVLDLDEVTLRKASGFDKSIWPNFADPKISAEIDKYYQGKNG